MKFDLEINNPPFQDTSKRGKTQHKLWIDFVIHSKKTLKSGGVLAYVTPDSFSSPSSKILKLMKEYDTKFISFDTKKYFQDEGNDPGSTFSHYIIKFSKNDKNSSTEILQNKNSCNVKLNNFLYIPNDFCEESYVIHNKVMFNSNEKLEVRYDYVTCHNNILKKKGSLSHVQKTQTLECVYPILHTNSQIWYSSIRQDFADSPKVMWSRSGYTKPFFDNGVLGCTDMCYYIIVNNESEGIALSHNLNTKLFRYIFKTAKWSGFGNEIVFKNLPKIPNVIMTDDEIYDYFDLNNEIKNYIDGKIR
jgi:hypothetical protein